MTPINVTVRRVDAEATEIAVKQWQNVHQSVIEGLQLGRDEWGVREVRCGEVRCGEVQCGEVRGEVR